MTLDEYLAKYTNPDDRITCTPDPTSEGEWPVVVVKRGSNVLVLHLCALDGEDPHVFVDARAFVDGEEARTGVFGMEAGMRYTLEDGAGASHTWPATKLVTLLVGKQTQTWTRS